MKKIVLAASVAIAGMFACSTAWAGTPSFGQGGLTVKPDQELKDMTLSVSGPRGFYKEVFADSGAPMIQLLDDGKLGDGLYRWNLVGSTDKRIEWLRKENNGRGEKERGYRYVHHSESGTFRVLEGKLVRDEEEPPTKRSSKEDRIEGEK